ncbi:MAG: hypothetical protein EA417_17515 [Gammaproteobacteria bacterium]|nr:MAG: hypothetical protein EA417_17515 [Gammaproteobacteria bacterium]
MDIDQAVTSPAIVFETPEQVLTAQELTDGQRCSILRQWSYDLRELLVATDENMASAGASDVHGDMLKRVDSLLRELESETPAPTMQGGV